MFFKDDLDKDAMRLYSTALQFDDLAGCFHRAVTRRLASQDVAFDAITDDDRAAIESEVVLDAIHQAARETLSGARDIFPNAVDEAVRLILAHIAETSIVRRARSGPHICSTKAH